jgi:hypothetical protein
VTKRLYKRPLNLREPFCSSGKEFKFKDWFYVEFIVVDFFLVVWTLLLN